MHKDDSLILWKEYCRMRYNELKKTIEAVDNNPKLVRQHLAELGTEMTPKEMIELVNLIRCTIEQIEEEHEDSN